MKKLIIYPLLSILAFTFVPTDSPAGNGLIKMELPNDSATKEMTMRIDEIHAMDKSTLTRGQKKSLRKEVCSIEKTIHQKTGGVYIYVSAGVLVIVLIILLIILL
jgi:hypothetical protein